ncbi:MAG: class I SAM-dependent methyltransferase [Marmoricola sp.]
MNHEAPDHAHSFGGVADSYARGRPSYPAEAATWLTGHGRHVVLDLGAGTGKLTRVLADAGHRVYATDPSVEMLAHLRRAAPEAHATVGTAEQIPVASRSIDVVVCAQAFHWFDHEAALPEIARVLRPGGCLALVWNQRDEGIPWVRKLGRLIGTEGQDEDLVKPLRETPYFGFVEERQFRIWQKLDRDTLMDLVRSRSYIAVMPEDERAALLTEVGSLYDDYGRGHDGMLLPYLTNCYRAVVRQQDPLAEPRRDEAAEDGEPTEESTRPPAPPEDPGTQLIDFR